MKPPPIILASGSAIRRQILESAGIGFTVQRPQLDEDALKQAQPDLNDAALAQYLAREKTLDVSRRHSGICLGADQILTFEDQRFDKAKTLDEARNRLRAMRGKSHCLVGGAAMARDGEIVWTHLGRSTIHMRDFSDSFLDAYIERAGEAILSSVACYQYEGLGAQLFDRVEGDYYAILGLPLLPVLSALRAQGALKS